MNDLPRLTDERRDETLVKAALIAGQLLKHVDQPYVAAATLARAINRILKPDRTQEITPALIVGLALIPDSTIRIREDHARNFGNATLNMCFAPITRNEHRKIPDADPETIRSAQLINVSNEAATKLAEDWERQGHDYRYLPFLRR